MKNRRQRTEVRFVFLACSFSTRNTNPINLFFQHFVFPIYVNFDNVVHVISEQHGIIHFLPLNSFTIHVPDQDRVVIEGRLEDFILMICSVSSK